MKHRFSAVRLMFVLVFATCTTPALSEISDAAICKAAIAVIMGRPPEIIRIFRTEGEVMFLGYVRPSDKSRWNYRCRVEGNRVHWASEPGRWRTDPSDEKIYFSPARNGKAIKITEDFGDSKNEEVMDLSKLQ